MKHLFLTVITGFLFASGVMAQSALRGVVTSRKDQPLSGATVQIKEVPFEVVTDDAGRFAFFNLKKDQNYTVVATFLGYRSETKNVVLKGDETIFIRLEEQAFTTQEVIVSATRAQENTPTSHQTIDLATIKGNNAGQELSYLLQLTPSLVASSDGGTGIGYSSFRIRGSDLTRINVTVNDIPINDAESHNVFWVNMPDFTESVNSIQIQRGVGTSSNGASAFGASVNLQSNSIESNPYAEVNNVLGSFNTRKNTVKAGTGLLENNLAFSVRLSQIKSDGFIDRASADMKSYYVSGGYYSDKHIIKANVFSGQQTTYQAWEGVPKVRLQNDTAGMRQFAIDSDYSMEETENLLNSNSRTFNRFLYHNQVDTYKQDHYQVFYTFAPEKNMHLKVGLHYTKGFGYYESYKYNKKLSSYGLPKIELGDTSIARTDLIARKYLDNDFYGAVASFSYKNEKLDLVVGGGANRYDGDHYGEVVWTKLSGGLIPKDFQFYKNSGVKDDANAYIRTNIQLTSNLDLYGDLQTRWINYKLEGMDDKSRDVTQNHDYFFFTPKVGAYYHQNAWSAYVSLGQGRREPARRNFTDADTIKGLPSSERLLDFESGVSYTSEHLVVQANYYHMSYRNQLILTGNVNDTGASIMENVDKSFRQGVELSLGVKFTDMIEWKINATLSENKIKNFIVYTDNWDTWGQNIDTIGTSTIAFSPSFIAGSMITFKPFNGFSMVLTDNFVSDQFIDNTSNDDRKLDRYWVTNLRINYERTIWKCNAVLFAQINNLYNREYASNAWVYSYVSNNEVRAMDGYFTQAGINFLVGLNLRF